MSLIRPIRHIASVYTGFLATCFARDMGFRFHFVMLLLVDLSFYVSSVASVHIIYDYTQNIGSFGRDELLFFVGFMLVVDQLHMALVSESFWSLSPTLIQGELDFVLLKPISALFQVFFRYIRPATLFLTPLVWGHLIYRAMILGFAWYQYALLPAVVALGAALLFGIEICIATSIFWMQQGQGVNFVRVELQGVSRWPDVAYRGWIRRFLTFGVPILVVGSQSSYFLIEPAPAPLLGLLGANLGVWLLARGLFRVGLRHYESASS